MHANENADPATVAAFSDQWRRFHWSNRQSNLSEQRRLFDRFFSLFPWDSVDRSSRGVDMGCGTGRFAQFVLSRVGHLTCIDASPVAIEAARDKLAPFDNVDFINAPVGSQAIYQKLGEGTLDFGYSYGVLMCVPDTEGAIRDCARLLKPGAPFLLYMYYNLDNRPDWYRLVWRASDRLRHAIARMPPGPRNALCEVLAGAAYWPLARAARLGEKLGANVENWPLTDFRHSSFLRMRNNSRDRFGTPLEKRFSLEEMKQMMRAAGFRDIVHRDGPPYWCLLGFRSDS